MIKKNIKDISVIKNLYVYGIKAKWSFLLALFFSIFSAIISPVRPWLIQYSFDKFISTKNNDNIEKYEYISSIFENISTCLSLNLFNFLFVLLFITLILEFISIYFQSIYTSILGQNVIKELRVEVYTKIISFKNAYFDNTPIGKLVTRTVSDIETISEVFSSGLLSVFADFTKIIFVIYIMLYTDVSLTIISLSTIPILVLATNYFRKGIKKSFAKVRDDVSALNTFVQENISGISIVKIFNKQKETYEKFKNLNNNHKKSNIKQIWYYSIYFPVVEIIVAISMGLLIWYGSSKVFTLEITPGVLMAFILYINMIFRPLRSIADNLNSIQLGIVSAKRVFKIIATNNMTIENKGVKSFSSLKKHEVKFENVYFSYDEKNKILSGLNFEVNDGETVAIVGETGAGKSTIVKLINRFYDVNLGKILIDNVDIRKLELGELRKNITIILQDVFLFTGSIKDNINISNKKISDKEIYDAIDFIGLTGFIQKFEKGIYHKVGERGELLSVGERQLVSFIRAFINRGKILILDEATANIDTESEKLIQSAVEKITKNQTSIVIAHRLSTIKNADRILVIENGKIVENGTHKQLIKNKGKFYTYYQTQYKNLENEI